MEMNRRQVIRIQGPRRLMIAKGDGIIGKACADEKYKNSAK